MNFKLEFHIYELNGVIIIGSDRVRSVAITLHFHCCYKDIKPCNIAFYFLNQYSITSHIYTTSLQMFPDLLSLCPRDSTRPTLIDGKSC